MLISKHLQKRFLHANQIKTRVLQKIYQRHRPSGFCYKIVCFDKRFNPKPVLYRAKDENEDIGQKFVEMLEEDIKRIREKFNFSKKMIFTEKDQSAFEKATVCWICQGEFDETQKKVRDHCHFTGKFRGAAHNLCNLKFKKPNFTPVIFHNLSGYDSHLFVKNLGKSEGDIKCIPNNEEKYISFSKDIVVVGEYENKKGEKKKIMHEIRFIDSFKFMASSLDSLVGNLVKSDNLETNSNSFQCKINFFNSDLTKFFQCVTSFFWHIFQCIINYFYNLAKFICPDLFLHKTAFFNNNLAQSSPEKEFGDAAKLMKRKGIYPYDYMNGIKKSFRKKNFLQKRHFIQS